MDTSCRRVRRSALTPVALELLLEAELQRLQAQPSPPKVIAMTLGTLAGTPVAGVGDITPTRVALAASRKLRGVTDDPVVKAFGAEPFFMSVVRLRGREPLLLTSIGARAASDVESGVRRILS